MGDVNNPHWVLQLHVCLKRASKILFRLYAHRLRRIDQTDRPIVTPMNLILIGPLSVCNVVLVYTAGFSNFARTERSSSVK